ncbi:hypothetical protein H1230_02570 [Paenibacillus sp. 19GGS1-52]|uniref:hypothetical protein n=1 Tax=Paenibacillus sp. 19GGS1-52 TaxID=2758563 RepID=UPI001EFA7520|nr:hypothetical protein [Paenibacillus sp. 19GGS1-52]ULO07771.1 hypothetical protein H1230_02570 [Paenibacillus sp. 19GGS1-52]
MKKKYRSAIIFAYVLIVLAGLIWHASGVSAEDTIKLTVNSHTTSTATMNNMEPGDETQSEYTVINAGNKVFNYYVDFKLLSGDVEMYDILQMTLEKEGVIIYSGVMSKAAGRVAIGSLAGGAQNVIEMNVIFPSEAGNEYQGKTATVAFDFSASGEPGPSTEPSAVPTATASPVPSTAPSTGPTATVSPGSSASPQVTPVISTPTPAPTPSPSASPIIGEIVATDAPIPLGGSDNNGGNTPTATPVAGSTTTDTITTPSPDHEIAVPDDELPLGASDAGDKLPNTAEPWYNLILISLPIAIISVMILRRLRTKR